MNTQYRWRELSAACRILLFLALVLLAACSQSNSPKTSRSQAESSLDRVVRTRTIRCSYIVYSPYFRKDPNTNAMSGIFHDVMMEIGRNANLTIEWTEEVGYENIFTGLDANRYDVFAGGLWPTTTRATVGSFTDPIFYSVITGWGRPDDNRFDVDFSAVNDPTVKIATIDGALEDIIAKADYPKAQRVSLPQLSPFTQNLLNVTSGKADLTFAEPSIVAEFLATNPGQLKLLAGGKAPRVFGNTLVIRRGESEFQEFLNVALRELLYGGKVDEILARYEPVPGAFPRMAIPYVLPTVAGK